MSLRARLAKLERGPAGRCPGCRDRPGEVALRIVECVIEDHEEDAARGPDRGRPPELAPCSRCGWKPRVVALEGVEDQGARGLGGRDDGST